MRLPDFRAISSFGLLATAGILMSGCIYEMPPQQRQVVVEREAPAPRREVVVEKEVPPVPTREVTVEREAPAPLREVVVERDAPEREVETIYVDEVHRGPIHEYYYYPGAEVYFDPFARNWFWFEGGVWRAGVVLPRHIHVIEGDRVYLRTDARRPFEVHERFRPRVDRYRHDHHYPDRGRDDHGGPNRYDNRHDDPHRDDHRNDNRRDDHRNDHRDDDRH